MTTPLSTEEIKRFRYKIKCLFYALTLTIAQAEMDFGCCWSCANHEMREKMALEDEDEGSYVFYHGQEANRLWKGADTVHIYHSIEKNDLDNVIKVLKDFGCDWNGDESEQIIIKFNKGFIPEQHREYFSDSDGDGD